ncbi:MAG: aminoacyl-histidine dipeptidase [Prevotellaceae bacterium]|jgi:dipeptidase D|nr:aminoacyl-histidine dipeptidase [Prevotellaceae bacterium]
MHTLEPSLVFAYFMEICRIPRPSKHEGKMIDYLLRFAETHRLPARRDAAGNVLISKAATAGMKERPVVSLQSHVDMVCEKNSDIVHDFFTDPIQPYVDGEWIKARGTTLGADCGIGMAASLALLASSDVPHGPVECLFTVDEETGLSGASALQPGFLSGNILLNLDSEDEGELFIGCAGGVDTTAVFSFRPDVTPDGWPAFTATVCGLVGGHSGDDINKGLANSNKLLTRFLWQAQRRFGIRLAYFDGGNLHNAIPREATATFVVPAAQAAALQQLFEQHASECRNEFRYTEPNMRHALTSAACPDTVIDRTTQEHLLNALYACPHGVIAMSRAMKDLVETSTNLASVKRQDDYTVKVVTSQRSSVESAKYDVARMVESVFVEAGATVTHGDGYPGWAPNPNSPVLKIAVEAYRRLFGEEPKVRAIHAGLECGLFLEKYPNLDMVSFGPTLRGVHSPDERLHIGSVQKFWDFMLEVLRSVR